jgi:hypothetical protein
MNGWSPAWHNPPKPGLLKTAAPPFAEHHNGHTFGPQTRIRIPTPSHTITSLPGLHDFCFPTTCNSDSKLIAIMRGEVSTVVWNLLVSYDRCWQQNLLLAMYITQVELGADYI